MVVAVVVATGPSAQVLPAEPTGPSLAEDLTPPSPLTIPQSEISEGLPDVVRDGIERPYSPVPEGRAHGARQLGRYPDLAGPAFPFLIEMLWDEPTAVPWGEGTNDYWLGPGEEARAALEAIGWPALAPLAGVLRTAEEPYVRYRALLRIDSPDGETLLQERLLDSGGFVRRAVLDALEERCSRLPVRNLARLAVEDQDDEIRSAVAAMLAAVRTPVEVEALCGLLRDPDPDVRALAVRTLGTVGDRAAVPHLVGVLCHEEPEARQAAAEALWQITGEDFGQDVERWRKWWEANRDAEKAGPLPWD